jgi:hypothetical protein
MDKCLHTTHDVVEGPSGKNLQRVERDDAKQAVLLLQREVEKHYNCGEVADRSTHTGTHTVKEGRHNTITRTFVNLGGDRRILK